jgi:hypothetical protein
MPSQDFQTAIDQLSVVHLARNVDQAKQIIQEARGRFPDLKVEEIQIGNGSPVMPAGAAVMLLFDKDFVLSAEATAWLAKWKQGRGWIPLLPVALDGGSSIPPEPFAGIKSRVWPQDQEQLLTTVGAYLGMAIRPGRTKLFISYRKADAFEAAKKLHDHFAKAGFDVFLDEADDRFDVPNLEIGDDVQAEIAEKLEASNAMILLDSPQAPGSKWMRVEIETAIGKPVPVVPVVLYTSGHEPSSRFRSVAGLHRRICIRTPEAGGQLQFTDSHLTAIASNLEQYLFNLYICRSVQPRRLARVFAQNQWQFDHHCRKGNLYDARTGTPPLPIFRMLACCSFEDPVFVPSVRAFLRDIDELGSGNERFARHLYFYPGNILYPDDLAFLQDQEIPELRTANTELIHYDEAVARINKLAGGFNAILV